MGESSSARWGCFLCYASDARTTLNHVSTDSVSIFPVEITIMTHISLCSLNKEITRKDQLTIAFQDIQINKTHSHYHLFG